MPAGAGPQCALSSLDEGETDGNLGRSRRETVEHVYREDLAPALRPGHETIAPSVRRHQVHLALRQKNIAHSAEPGSQASSNKGASHVPPDLTIRRYNPRPNRAEDVQALEADARLRDDIRLLGRILGDTVRDQEGADLFDLVERIRQTSIRFHRDEDRLARRELEQILDSMSTSETVRIVRAFSYFSHLANIAEDQNNIRQMRAPEGGGSGVLAETLAACQGRPGIGADALRNFFESALVSPVLTAHPTEVRRKSTMDREMEVAALLDRRERVALTAEEAAASDEQLRREVLTLWQTNLLRRTKLTVLDEVANGLSFYDYTFLREVPRLVNALEDRLEEGGEQARASSPRSCAWEAGSAAIATAIPSSPPTSCAARCGCSRAG